MREFDLLQHVFAHNRSLPAGVTIPPGDDMGAMTIAGATVLVTVDQVLDGVHVDVANTSLARVGRKAVTRNLSDVAAMAARPCGAVVAATLPRDFGEERARELYDAMRATASAYACPLIGGDTAIWDGPLVLTVTVFAEPAGVEPVLRQGAKLGDAIYVTGQLGGSLASGHHLDFEPRIALARRLASDPATRPHCMLDLSDGLARDLSHLCRFADLGAVVDAALLPLRGRADWYAAIGDGEDYELCFTIDSKRADALPPAIDGVPLTRVGVITSEPSLLIRHRDGKTQDMTDRGWEHHGS